MLTTVFVVGLNAPSLPLLPLFTSAQQISGSQTAATTAVTNPAYRFAFIWFPFVSLHQLPAATAA
ncbi:MAG: hypothetical protein WCK27_19725 [Verrucomicrobiota bacterium]